MRTRDFSAIPVPQGHTGAVFIGMNTYRRPWHLAEQVMMWAPLARRLKKAPGYLWHLSYFRFPMRIGLVVGFESREALMQFATTDEHHAIMHWLIGTDADSGARSANPAKAPVKGGFIRILTADEVGYASGPWRADQDELELIRRWTAQAAPSGSKPHELPARLRARLSGIGQVTEFLRGVTGYTTDAITSRWKRRSP